MFPIFFVVKAMYRFVSFWNRNHTIRALQLAVRNFVMMIEAEKKDRSSSSRAVAVDRSSLQL
jgi:hypothetical protein